MIKNHYIDKFGVLNQIKTKGFIYNQEYLEYYFKMRDKTQKLSKKRFSFIDENICFDSVLDFGCGDRSFINICADNKKKSYGYDIIEYNKKNGVITLKNFDDIFQYNFDVVCFFDSLEHVKNLSFLGRLKTKYIVISVPYCHYLNDFDENKFYNWKHYKENEHLHYFNFESLVKLFNNYGYVLKTQSNFEDSIRTSKDKKANILSCLFRNVK